MERAVSPRSGSRYRIESRIGAGGFGAVYRATMTTEGGLEKDVALKVLHETQSSGDEIARLRDEARLLTVLNHRAIVRVVDLVQLSIGWTVVMELVEGLDLHQIRQMATFPPRPAVEVVEEVAQALHEAWTTDRGNGALRLVHRDIKPANLKLTRAGDVKVLDFGIASGNLEGREAQTATNEVLGTIRYMAPERFEGRSGPESDIYALGVVLAELLGQRSNGPLHDGRRLQQTLRSVGHLGGPELAELIERMLEYDPENRPTALEVARECRQLAFRVYGPPLVDWAMDVIPELTEEQPKTDDDPLVGTTLTATHRIEPASRPSRLLPALLGMGLFATVAVGAAFVLGSLVTGSAIWVGSSGPSEPYRLQRMTEMQDVPLDAREVSLSPDGNQLVYDSAGDVFVHPIGGRASNLTETLDVKAFSPVFSPDGTQVAFAVDNGTVEVRTIDGTPVRSFTTQARPQDWDTDAMLLLEEGQEPGLFLETGGQTRLVARGLGWKTARWDRRSERALVASNNALTWVATDGSTEAMTVAGKSADVSFDGASVLFSDYDGKESRLHVRDGMEEPRQETHLSGSITGIASASEAPRAVLSNRIRRNRFHLIEIDAAARSVVEDRVLPLPDHVLAAGLMPTADALMWVETNENRSPGTRDVMWDETIWLGDLDGEKTRAMARMQSVWSATAGMDAAHLTQYIYQELPGNRGRLVAVDLTESKPPRHLADLPPKLWDSVWVSPVGDRVAITDADGRMHVVPLNGPITSLSASPTTGNWTTLGWDHDATAVFAIDTKGDLALFDAETLEQTPLATGIEDAVAVPGGLVILQRAHALSWFSLDTREEWPLMDVDADSFVFEPTPDGRFILLTEIRVKRKTWVADFSRD